ncbi:MAG: gliding motility-associated C-terminal domain-containing protein, partial [Phaeodactylibacter sp.]|nr:gliding motility-associated C-terminal domain-containing protein [Phaeodactylibacter sp.]
DDGISYAWSGPGVSQADDQFLQVSVQETSTYYLTITDAMGCVSLDSATIEALPLPVADAGPDSVQFCPGETFELNATFGPNLQYSWSPGILLNDPGSRTPLIVNPVEGWYQVLVENAAGCQATDSIYVSFAAAPDLELSGTTLLCLGDADTLQANGGLAYAWMGDFPVTCLNPPLCSQVAVEPSMSGTIQVVGTNAAACADTASLSIEVVADEMQTLEQMQTCFGEPVPVFDELSDVPGLYCDTTLTGSGCLLIHCIELTVFDTIVEELEVQLCPGETFEFGGQSLGESGTYVDFLSTQSGCDSTVRLELSVTVLETVSIEASQDSIFPGESVALNLIGAVDGSQFAWSPAADLSCSDCPNPTAMPNEGTTYTLTLTDPNGCVQILEYAIAVDKNCHLERVEVPNVFTPNNDGLNDRFGPLLPGGQEQITRFEVYNRWGQLVYSGRPGQWSWDGTFDGVLLPTDVYVYRISISCLEEERQLVGEVSLLR